MFDSSCILEDISLSNSNSRHASDWRFLPNSDEIAFISRSMDDGLNNGSMKN